MASTGPKNYFPGVSSYPVMGENYFRKDGDPLEVRIIVILKYFDYTRLKQKDMY